MKIYSKGLVVTVAVMVVLWGCDTGTDSNKSREMILSGTNGQYWSDVRLKSGSGVGIGNRIFLKNDKTASIQFVRSLWQGNWELINDNKLIFFQLTNAQRVRYRTYEIIALSSEEMKLRQVDSTTIETYQLEK